MQFASLPVVKGVRNRFFTVLSQLAVVSILSMLSMTVAAQVAFEPDAKELKFWNDHEPDSGMQVNHEPWQELLNKYVNDAHPSGINRFDYSAVSNVDRQALKDYLEYLQLLEPRQLNLEEAKAYWLNLYNAILVDNIVDVVQSTPIKSVREIKSGAFRAWPWTRDAVEILFKRLSLNEIEHNIIRPIYQDPRVHYVLAKGSLGGGGLLKTAFNGENNEVLLKQAEKKFLNHSRAISISANGSVQLSAIFEWYASDFAASNAELMAYFAEHVTYDIPQTKKIKYQYDWTLNRP